MIDINGNGQIDTQEYGNFYSMFVSKFETHDKDLDGLLDKDGVIE